jgi:hypothetical protein
MDPGNLCVLHGWAKTKPPSGPQTPRVWTVTNNTAACCRQPRKPPPTPKSKSSSRPLRTPKILSSSPAATGQAETHKTRQETRLSGSDFPTRSRLGGGPRPRRGSRISRRPTGVPRPMPESMKNQLTRWWLPPPPPPLLPGIALECFIEVAVAGVQVEGARFGRRFRVDVRRINGVNNVTVFYIFV